LLKNFKPQKNDFITGQKFVELADVVFAANLPNNDFAKINNLNIKVIAKNEHLTSFKTKILKIKDGDIVYCSSNHVELFFYYIEKNKDINNITLISSQSDKVIDKKLFNKMPKSIHKWYSTNVAYNNEKLIPIPLGIANSYSPKNIRVDDFKNFSQKSSEKIDKLYINLQKNTNFKERSNIHNLFLNKEWVVQREPNLEIIDYMNDLSKYKFVLCPWGNGVDTHRLWEVLYLGSIPVTKFHKTYESVKNLPIIFVDNYKDINLDFLSEKLDLLNNSSSEELQFKFWQNKIKLVSENLDNTTVEVSESNFYEFYFWNKKRLVHKFNSKLKIFKYYLKKIRLLLLGTY